MTEETKKKAPTKKRAPRKKAVQTKEAAPIAEAPKPASTSRAHAQKKSGGGLGVFILLIVIVVGGFLVFQQLTNQDIRQQLEDKISSLEKETNTILSEQSELKRDKGELEEMIKENETELEQAKLQLREVDIRANRKEGEEVGYKELCAEDGQNLADGTVEYPVHPTYDGLLDIGQLFTAADCNDEVRMAEIAEQVAARPLMAYDLTLFSESAPDEDEQTLLTDAGFVCATSMGDEETCDRWQLTLTEELDLVAILELRSIVDLIREG